MTARRCACGHFIKTDAAKVCQSCRPQQYKKTQGKIIEKRMSAPRSRVVLTQERRSDE